METTRLSSKGQVIIPKAVRDARGWGEGTEFVVETMGDGIVLRPARLFPVTKLDDVFGILKFDGPPKLIVEMNQGVDEAVRADWMGNSK